MKKIHIAKRRLDNYLQYIQNAVGGEIIDKYGLKVKNDLLDGEFFIYEKKEIRFLVGDYKPLQDFTVFFEHDTKYDYSIKCFIKNIHYSKKENKEELELKLPLGFLLVKEDDILNAYRKNGENIHLVSLYFNKDSVSELINDVFQKVDLFSFNLGDKKFISWKENFFSHPRNTFNKDLYNSWVKLKLNELFIVIQNNILDNINKDRKNRIFHDYEFQIASDIKDSIDKNPTFKPNVKDLAKEYGINVTKLSKVYKYIYGMPLYKYYNTQRIIRAKDMILNTNKTLSEIAYELGFTDINHLSKSFKEKFDMNPSDLKKI